MQLFLLVLILAYACAESVVADTGCVSPSSYESLIFCAESRSPEVQSAWLELDRAKAQVQAAGQWQNPELSAETFQGKFAGEKRQETDIALGIPIELGGKISARTAVAKGGVASAEANLFLARAKVRSQVFLKLHRLRQVIHEQQIADEAIATFSKLVNQYAKRPGLSPEQQVSASVFQLSKNDYDLKRSIANDEIVALDSFFKLNLGIGANEIKSVLPQSPKKWPQPSSSTEKRISPQQRILQAELETAQADLSVARSESWPTLTVGPSLKMLNEGGQSDNLMGMNVSFPIPVFNLNGGARAAANAAVKVSETKRQNGLREQELRREELLKIYEQAVKSLEGSISHDEIEKKHLQSERLFTKGVVPSSLVIEAHRTSFDLEKTRHERELKALEALLDLYTIEGAILEVKL